MKLILTQRFSTSHIVTLIAAICTLFVPGLANADSRINDCSRWNKEAPLEWLSTQDNIQASRHIASLLMAARSHGLDPADYQADELAQQLVILSSGSGSDLQRNEFNARFTRSVLCYVQNVSGGRLNPYGLYKEIWLPRQQFDQREPLQAALTAGKVQDYVLSAAPQSDDYANLRNSLTGLSDLASREGDLSDLRLSGVTSVKPGQRHNVILAVRQRLEFLGDFKSADGISGTQFDSVPDTHPKDLLDPVLETAVRRFQERHGLTVDGMVGREVLKAMRTPLTHRIAQAELAMERIRWYPRSSARMVRVNIPDFSMQAVAPDADGLPSTLTSKVIVGQAGKRHTPLFAGPLTRIELSPMWFVPTSIARKALLPTIRSNPSYLENRDFEFRMASGATTQRVNSALLRGVARGSVRIQQRQGKHNALGQVKFVLPNSRAIYLHDTNKPQLFELDSRSLSYGCVRVAKPLALAKLLLADNTNWTARSVEVAASSSRTVVAKPATETTVMLQYLT
ncbi:MAG: L,D-transpeptidase family protein, partial [Burkholderiaceae bacterium]